MFSRGIGIASTLVLSRLLDTTDFGIVAVAFTISAALNSVSNIGVTESLVRLKVVGRAELDTGFTIQFVKGGITGLLLLAVAPVAANWFSDARLTNVIYILAATFALAGLENIGIINFRRDMRFNREFQLSAVERVLNFGATLAAALILRSYWALVIGLVIARIVRVIATYAMEPYRPRFGLQAWRELARFSLWMWLSSLAYIVWIRADPLVVGSQVSAGVLGLYVVALDIALLPATEIMEPIGAVLFASFAAEHNAGRDPRGNAFILAVSLMAVMAPVALVISASSTDIVGVLLGSKWSSAAPIIAVLAFAVVLSPFSNTASQSLTASGKVNLNLIVVVLASIVKVCVLLIAARTGDLHVIAASALAITSVESTMFILVLQLNGSKLSRVGWSIARIVTAVLLAALILQKTGIAWAGDEKLPILTCLWQGAVLGVVGFSSYSGVLSGLWILAGRPNGPEQQVASIIISIVTRLSRQFSVLSAYGRRSQPK